MTQRAPHIGLKLIRSPFAVEASLWRRLRFEQDLSCRDDLFEKHAGVARSIAAKEHRRRPAYGLDRADFEQLAYSGLLEAIDRFDPLLGAPFDAYARHRIRGAIADGAARSSESGAQFNHRRRMERERLKSLTENLSDTGGDHIAQLAELVIGLALGMVAETSECADDPRTDVYGSLFWQEMQLILAKEIGRLPEAEKLIMQKHYFAGVRFTDIADMLALSRGRVSQLHAAALARLRLRMGGFD